MNKSNILVSLIIPCYGVEEYLHRCVDSVTAQTHKKLEIILVNDGSPDKSGEIADKLASYDERIMVIHKPNGGVSTARNVGIDAARGEYICFADGDDWLEPDYVEYLLGMAVDTESEIALSDRIYVSTRDDVGLKDSDSGSEVVSSSECIKRQFYYKIRTEAVFNKIYKASLFEDGTRFNPEFFMGEGFNFNIGLYKKATQIAIGHKRVYWYFKENSDSATSRFSMRHIENGLRSIDDMGVKVEDLDISVVRAWRYAKYHTVCDFYAGMIKAGAKRDFPERYKSLSRYCRRHLIDALRAPIGLKEKARPIIFAMLPGTMITRIISSKLVYGMYVKRRNV